jgi:hypothetical protein
MRMLVRWGAIGFVLGGIAWTVLNLVTLTQNPVTGPSAFSLVLYIVALLLSVVGVVGLHALQKENYGLIGRGGFWVVVAFFATSILGTVVLLSGSTALDWLVFPVGQTGILVGFVLYGTATLQARVLPTWYGVALIILLPVAVALGVYGTIWVGLVQLALGYVLWTRSGTAAQQSSRVR